MLPRAPADSSHLSALLLLHKFLCNNSYAIIPTLGSAKLTRGLSLQSTCFPPLKANTIQKAELPPLCHHNKHLANMTAEVKRCSAVLAGTSATSIMWRVGHSFPFCRETAQKNQGHASDWFYLKIFSFANLRDLLSFLI